MSAPAPVPTSYAGHPQIKVRLVPKAESAPAVAVRWLRVAWASGSPAFSLPTSDPHSATEFRSKTAAARVLRSLTKKRDDRLAEFRAEVRQLFTDGSWRVVS